MTTPVYCHKCGVLIGEIKSAGMESALKHKDVPLNNGIVCNHPKPKITETIRLLGLIKEVRVEYSEIDSIIFDDEYIGPPNKFTLWIAIFFSNDDGVRVNGQMAYWDVDIGFFGDGVLELKRLQAKAV